MPNYVAHEYFGARLEERLPEELSASIKAAPLAFCCGLYGPDPLMFIPGGLAISRRLHAEWKEKHTEPIIETLHGESDAARSFAIGYFSHQLLDDVCHEYIYAVMREQGLSHQLMELGLDALLLKQMGKQYFPAPNVEIRNHAGKLASDLLHPLRAFEYSLGLGSMGLLCKQIGTFQPRWERRLTTSYHEAATQLLHLVDNSVDEALLWLEDAMTAQKPALPLVAFS